MTRQRWGMDRPDQTTDSPAPIHASAVAVAARGLLICGASGSGKSSLALAMMALGADLIADDRVCITREQDQVILNAPTAIASMIEAHGLGILSATAVSNIPLAAILDLDVGEVQRLPPMRHATLLGCSFPLLHNSASPYFPAALMQYLKGGRRE